MSKALHTPGPWFVPTKSFGTLYVEARIGGGMLQEVAAVGPTEKSEQQEANARLISAAPDLLEALEKIEKAAFATVCNPEWIANHARAAIAKATGDAP